MSKLKPFKCGSCHKEIPHDVNVVHVCEPCASMRDENIELKNEIDKLNRELDLRCKACEKRT